MKDLTGQIFGRLTVLAFADYQDVTRVATGPCNRWMCQCSCGKKCIVRESNLLARTKSCRCLRNEQAARNAATGGLKRRFTFETASEAAFKDLFVRTRRSAKRRHRTFEIDLETFRSISTKNCHYCGEIPNMKHFYGRVKGEFIHNGIDRVDTTLGYVTGNVVPCCSQCNLSKLDWPEDDFIRWVVNVYNTMSAKSWNHKLPDYSTLDFSPITVPDKKRDWHSPVKRKPSFVEIGQKYGQLTVLSFSHKEGPTKKDLHVYKFWLCQCDCGNQKVIRGNVLTRYNATLSCGCRKKWGSRYNSKKPLGYSAVTHFFHSIERAARRRGFTCSLNREQVRVISCQKCHYCGKIPSQVYKTNNCNGNHIYNGLDRVDSLRNYDIENVVPACCQCNLAKNDYSIEEFVLWVKKICRNLLDCGKLKFDNSTLLSTL